MVKRLLVGLFLGFLVGLAVAAALTHGLALSFDGGFGAIAGYLSAAATGVLVGLVTGKPIWSAHGKIEAGLKAFFGGLLAAGALLVLRRFVHVDVDLGFLNAAATGQLGDTPYAALPPIAAVLGAFFEADNTPEPEANEGARTPGPKVRLSEPAAGDELEDEPAAQKRASRR